jgi:flagellar protein FlaG
MDSGLPWSPVSHRRGGGRLVRPPPFMRFNRGDGRRKDGVMKEMKAKVSPVSSAADVGIPVRSAMGPAPAGHERSAPVSPQADLRLVIEEDPKSGSYVYKTLNRRTGEVVQQLPIEDILKLRRAETYQAGAVINAKA